MSPAAFHPSPEMAETGLAAELSGLRQEQRDQTDKKCKERKVFFAIDPIFPFVLWSQRGGQSTMHLPSRDPIWELEW